MYIVNSDALARNLKMGTVSQKDKLIYFLLFILFHSFTFYKVDALGGLIDLTITFIGVSICYKVNKQGDNKEFIERFICLSLPINLSVILISSIPILILAVVVAGAKWNVECVSLFIVLSLRIWFYSWMRLHLLNISRTTEKVPINNEG